VTALRRALALLALTALALSVRLWGITFPPYHGDEGYNYVVPAVTYFAGDLNPHRFDNPTLLSYLFHGLYRVWYSVGGFDSPYVFMAQLHWTPEPFYVIARVLVALMGALTCRWSGPRRVNLRPRAPAVNALFWQAFLLCATFAVSDVPDRRGNAYMALRWQDAAHEEAWFYARRGIGARPGDGHKPPPISICRWCGPAWRFSRSSGCDAVAAGHLVAASSWRSSFMATCPYCFSTWTRRRFRCGRCRAAASRDFWDCA
jgi:hypothetical protein